eukprot:Skav224137  [mRNA]  locus=scaffold462:142971:143366:- [translate_table: standard]
MFQLQSMALQGRDETPRRVVRDGTPTRRESPLHRSDLGRLTRDATPPRQQRQATPPRRREGLTLAPREATPTRNDLRRDPTPTRREPIWRRDPTPTRREPTPTRRELPARREATPTRREPTPTRREPMPPV